MLAGLRVRLRALLRKDQMDRELDEELLYHIEKQTDRNVAGGMEPREARLAALRDFGGVEQMKEEVRDARGVRFVEEAMQDARFGVRMLRKNPTFTLVAVVVLALGIGANTAIFTLLDAVVLKPLPVSNPDQLVLFSDTPSEGTMAGDPSSDQWHLFSYAVYKYFREHDEAFQDLCAFRTSEARLAVRAEGAQSGDSAERAQGHLVSGNYFDVLGVAAARGRALTPADDAPTAPPAAVISHGYWKEKLNGDPSAVGRVVSLNGTSFTIVGVMPEEFFGVRVRRSPDYWLPLSFQPQVELQESYLEDSTYYWLNFMGRPKPGVTLERAQAEVNVALKQYLTAEAGTELTDERRDAIQSAYIQLASGERGISGLRSRYTEPLAILMAVVALILLIACANVGNLLLSRSLARRREILVRLALGARRWRLIRQLLTESLLLAALGGVLGVLLARWGASLLVAQVAPGSPLDIAPDAKALGFTVGVSLLAGILFGLAPALHSSRTQLWTGLKESSNKTAEGRQRFGLASVLVVSQVALSLVLLVGAAMFARSLLNLQADDLGFRGEKLLLVDIDPRIAGYKPEELPDLYRRVLDTVGAVPGVQSATSATYSPMSGNARSSNISAQGYVPEQDEDMNIKHMFVGPKYAETLVMPVLAGREFGPKDMAGSPAVAIVNKAFADYYFKGQAAVGRRFCFGDEFDEGQSLEIVGVVGNAKYDEVREQPERMAFQPMLQDATRSNFNCNLELRTVSDPLGVAPAVRAALAQSDPRLPVVRVTSFSQQFEESLQQERLMAQLVAAFGVLALVLSCVGLYGVMAQAVARRTNEIGVRMALGANPAAILRMVLGEAMVQVGVGVGIGLLGAAAAARIISSMLYGVGAIDPVAIAISLLVMFATGFLAGYIPARRATKVDPAITLRYE